MAVYKVRWGSLFFAGSLTLVTLIGVPLYVYAFGVTRFDMWLFAFYVAATSLAISVGYHRLYSHRAYEAHPILHFLVLFFGAAAFEQSALKWASQHRSHHLYVDTERDPYNIQKGFFYAHMGWILFWKHVIELDNVQDLQKNKLLMHQHVYYRIWAPVAGVFVPIVVGAAFGHALGAALFAVVARLTLVHHSTFFINSFAHSFGTAQYDSTSSAKDNWVGALLTNGEGYHNFHHRFPSDYRNGIRWYHWDPCKWLIKGLEPLKLTYSLKQATTSQIQQAIQTTRAIYDKRSQ